MTTPDSPDTDFLPVADIEIDQVTHDRDHFVLSGTGRDGAEYEVRLNLEIPVDKHTSDVLAEILSQCGWQIRRRPNRSVNEIRRALKRNRDRRAARRKTVPKA